MNHTFVRLDTKYNCPALVKQTLSINAWSESSWVDLHRSTLKECATQEKILLSPHWVVRIGGLSLSTVLRWPEGKKSKFCII